MNSTKKSNNQSPKKKIGKYFWYDFVKITGAPSALLWTRPKVYGLNGKKPPKIKGGVLVSSNHISFEDPIIVLCVFWYRRLFSLATKDLYKNKLLEIMFGCMHCIQVDKGNFSMKSLHAVFEYLSEDKAVLIFPEGRVNLQDTQMSSFKSGAVLMAHRTKKPILPIYLVKPKKWYHRREIIIGEPFDVADSLGDYPTMQDMARVSDELRQKELELCEYYNNISKEKNK